MNLDLVTRQKICQLVAGIVTVDGQLHVKEAAFLHRVTERFGTNVMARETIVPLADPEAAAAQMKELPRAAQDEAFRLIVEAACIDGTIAPEERVYLEAIGSALGIAKEELERRVVDKLIG